MNNNVIGIYYRRQKVGRLTRTKDRVCAFEYDGAWLTGGFSISPFSLPLERKVFIARRDPFEGNFGVFDDSLPDGWGRLLIDRMLVQKSFDPAAVSLLDRLALVGSGGMGALEYRPEERLVTSDVTGGTDELAREVREILREREPSGKALYDLVQLAGSSGGARPKVLLKLDGDDWLVKFPASNDPEDIGKQEYRYSEAARKAGLEIPETRLLEGRYFAVRRFDRQGGEKIHMLSAGGLLEASHRLPSLDYNALLSATLKLCRDYGEVEKMYRLMCFNVMAHNRDDHAKNFAFLYDDGRWTVSPAYDLVYAEGMGGEHATSIDGEGKNPDGRHILNVALKAGLDPRRAKRILAEVETATEGLF
jgi:serine/threonine-protein kinase HipA